MWVNGLLPQSPFDQYTEARERGKGAGLKRGRESTYYMHGLSFSRWVSVGGFPSVNRSSFILFPFSIFLLLLTSTCGCLWEAQLTNKIQLGNATFNWWPHKREDMFVFLRQPTVSANGHPLITFNMILNMSKLEETAPSLLGICPLVATEYYWMRMTITARAKD